MTENGNQRGRETEKRSIKKKKIGKFIKRAMKGKSFLIHGDFLISKINYSF